MTTFGIPLIGMVQERAPLQTDQVPDLLESWTQAVGGFAAVGLLFWGILYLVRQPPAGSVERPVWFRMVFLLGSIVAAVAYLLAAVFAWLEPNAVSPCLTLGGIGALLAAGLPFALDLAKLRPRRIWGLAVLSVKEGLHRWVLWIFIPLALVFLVLGWFVPHKPEDQLRTYVQIVYWVMTPLLLVTAALLAAFSIPNDVRSHTIATIVTKPVERFEIVLGRFLGYVSLMSGILVVMAILSLGFVYIEGVPKGAAAESLRARVPVYGELGFIGKTPDFKGQDAVEEWQYRRYIAGGPDSPQRAVWVFTALPGRLNERETVPCEMRFDIFRYRKPEKEGQGVFCTFAFHTRHGIRITEAAQRAYQEELRAVRAQQTDPDAYAVAIDGLAEKYGIFEVPAKEISDSHTYVIDVPAGLFRNAARAVPGEMPPADGKPVPLVAVQVKCDSPGQLLGMARHDLYFVDGEGYFGLNFIKGTLGLWFRLCLVIGVAVAVSTYLSGVISLVVTLFLYLFGVFTDYIQSVAAGKNDEGGPLQAFQSIISGPQVVEKTSAGARDFFDDAFRWYLRRLLSVLPDVDLFSLTSFVADGFDISWEALALRTLVLAGYLLPWAVLAYYLLKSREMAA